MTPPRSNLAVLIDGTLLPDPEARALWERFSDWMEDHRGDLAGFAASEGLASIHPAVDGGRPVLIGSKHETAQRPYAPAASVTVGLGGSADRQQVTSSTPGKRSRGTNKRRNR